MNKEVWINKPIYKIDNYGTKSWRLNGKLHRLDGPALEYTDGEKRWCLDGYLHRENGPAYEGSDGSGSWYLNGEYLEYLTFKLIMDLINE